MNNWVEDTSRANQLPGGITKIIDMLIQRTGELIVENRFSSKDAETRNVMLTMASIFGTRNISNALDILDANSNASRGQRWQNNRTEANLSEPETIVTEFTAMTSGRTILKVRGTSGRFHYNIPGCNRCSCEAWHRNIWKATGQPSAGEKVKKEGARRNMESNSTITCKHVLAAELAKSMWKAVALKTKNDEIHGPLNYNIETDQLTRNQRDCVFKRVSRTEEEFIQMIIDMD